MRKYLKYLTYIMLFFAILPLFFVNEIYSRKIYIILFIYFMFTIIYEYIINNREKKNCKKKTLFLILDLISTISLLTPYNILILLRMTKISTYLFEYRGFKVIKLILIRNKEMFTVIFFMITIYTIFVSILMFQIEPSTFNNRYFDALYWSVITLASVGYGDIVPVTDLGKILTMISSILGIAIVALPAGIIASEFLDIAKERKD